MCERPNIDGGGLPSFWLCDWCGRRCVEDDGVLSYRVQPAEPFAISDFRVLHTDPCHPAWAAGDRDVVADPLADYVGPAGLTALLAFLSAGPARCDEPGVVVSDVDQLTDVIRRLHTPLYELARGLFTRSDVVAQLRNDSRSHAYQESALHELLRRNAMTRPDGGPAPDRPGPPT